MIKPLRATHLLIWKALAVLLPASIVVAWLSIPQQPLQPLLQPAQQQALPVVVKKIDYPNYTVAVRRSADASALQLEWINKTTLQYPTATIYSVSKGAGMDHAKLIGRIEARGDWYFALDASFNASPVATDHFILYDFIHRQIIDTINFTP